jgi:hypothetical protein
VVYYIAVFAKMQFFKILVKIFFRSIFCLLSSRQHFSAVSGLICTKFGMNLSSCVQFILRRAVFEKVKNQVTAAKKKIRKNFRPCRHFFACDVQVKVF